MTYYFLLCKTCNTTVAPYTDRKIALADLISHTGSRNHDCEIRECHPNWEPVDDEAIMDEPGFAEEMFPE